MKKNAPNTTMPHLTTFKLSAMGCHIQISLNVTKLHLQYSQATIDQQIALLTSDVQQRLTYWERIFSRFDETSELMRLNNHTDQWTEASAELFEVLQRAIHFVSKTEGLVTPTLLKSLWAAGYKHSFETLPKVSMLSAPVISSNATSKFARCAHYEPSQSVHRRYSASYISWRAASNISSIRHGAGFEWVC